jgi:hypothetical protein
MQGGFPPMNMNPFGMDFGSGQGSGGGQAGTK